jgi:ATP-dependent helicase YprA (DUF1998 family)
VEASILLSSLVLGGMRTLVFCRVRKVAELMLQYTHERLAVADAAEMRHGAGASPGSSGAATSSGLSGSKRPRPLSLISKVKSYRAGYLKHHRRAIEADLFSGRLLGVVATNALELGVDIGSLDCVVILGYPGSIASLWQQMGRAGRGGRDSVAILLTWDSPVDQHWVKHPQQLLVKPPEAALVDPANLNILRLHALCAGAELPLHPLVDVQLFGEGLGHVVSQLREDDSLLPLEGRENEAYAQSRLESFQALALQDEQRRAWWAAGAAQEAAGEEQLMGVGAHGLTIDGHAAAARPGGATGSSLHHPTLGRLLCFRTAGWLDRPSSKVSLRSIDDVRYRVLDVGSGGQTTLAMLNAQQHQGHDGASYDSAADAGSSAGYTLVDEVEESRAYWEIHEGAMYHNSGVTYKILRLDTDNKVAYARITNEQYYTTLRDHCNVNALSRASVEMGKGLRRLQQQHDAAEAAASAAGIPAVGEVDLPTVAGCASGNCGGSISAGGASSQQPIPRTVSQALGPRDGTSLLEASGSGACGGGVPSDVTSDSTASASLGPLCRGTHFGRAQVMFHAWGYRKVWKRTGEVFEFCELTLPPLEFTTYALWTDLSLELKRWLDARRLDFLGGCHGAAHAVMAVLPLFIMCDRVDLGTECPSPLQHRARPLRFIVYDQQPGGVGICAAAFTIARTIYRAALQLVEDCVCGDGCPSCIHDLHCREFNYVLDKAATKAILRFALGMSLADLPVRPH